MRIRELDLSRAAAVDETEEEEPVESEDEMELETLPLPVADYKRVRKSPTAGDGFRCEGPWVSAGKFRFRSIYPKVPVEEYQECEGEMEPVPVDDQERVQEPLPVPVDDRERVQERSTRRRQQQQADAADGSRCKRPRRVQERRNDARCKRPSAFQSLRILFTKEEEVKAAVSQMEFQVGAGTLTHESLLKKLQELKIRHEREFHTCDVAGAVCQFAQPLLRCWFLGWQEAMEKRKPGVYHGPASWSRSSREANETREAAVYRETIALWKELLLPHQKYMCPDALTCPYTELVTEVVLPVMRRYIINSCDPLYTPDFIVSWVPLLPQIVLEALLMQAVAPKLSAILDSWNHKTAGRYSFSLWAMVKPWSHIVREKVEDYVRQAIRTGRPSALCAFKEVIDPAVWEDLSMRHIIPILKMKLQNIEFSRIPTQSEQFSQFGLVMKKSFMVPLNLLVRFLESNFFPNWFDELYHWLDSGEADLNEVLIWYQSWRCLFTSDLIEHERIQLLLTSALHMTLQAANGEPVDEPLFLHNYNLNPAPTDKSWYEHLTFKELIGEYAVDQDLLFVPKFGKFHDGLPVYAFGSVSICLDPIKRLLYAQIHQGGVTTWKSVSLTELVAMNK